MIKLFGDKIDDAIFSRENKFFNDNEILYLEKFNNLLSKNFKNLEIKDSSRTRTPDSGFQSEYIKKDYLVESKLVRIQFSKIYCNEKKYFRECHQLWADEDEYTYKFPKNRKSLNLPKEAFKDIPDLKYITGLKMYVSIPPKTYFWSTFYTQKNDFDDFTEDYYSLIPIRYIVSTLTDKTKERLMERFNFCIEGIKNAVNK